MAKRKEEEGRKAGRERGRRGVNSIWPNVPKPAGFSTHESRKSYYRAMYSMESNLLGRITRGQRAHKLRPHSNTEKSATQRIIEAKITHTHELVTLQTMTSRVPVSARRPPLPSPEPLRFPGGQRGPA